MIKGLNITCELYIISMVIDIGGKKNRIESGVYLLGFRDTVILTIGFLSKPMTKFSLYQVYQRLHQQLNRIEVVGFDLPSREVFTNMVRKLIRENLLNEKYMNQNYGVILTNRGQAAFEVILSNLQVHPRFARITNVYEFYNQSAAY